MSNQPVVFVVDDDPSVLESTAALMDSVGLKVTTFASGEEFLDAYLPHQRGCLLLDVRLPGISGIELARKLQSDAVDLPVILISGHANADVCEERISDNVVVYLEKPINSHDLIEQIRNVISGI